MFAEANFFPSAEVPISFRARVRQCQSGRTSLQGRRGNLRLKPGQFICEHIGRENESARKNERTKKKQRGRN